MSFNARENKHLIQAIMNDFYESSYVNISSYWKDHVSYWLGKFSTDTGQKICEEMEDIIF